MSTARFPPFLKKGDLVFITSPAYTAQKQMVEAGLKVLNDWGLNIETGESVTSILGPFAGSDEIRFADFQRALDRHEFKAILCTRGGYGITRYIDQLNWDGFAQNPKWLIGFSDVTALHLALQQPGFTSIHGPMLVHLAQPNNELAVTYLHDILFGKSNSLSYEIRIERGDFTHPIEGELVGGNLCLLVNSLATISEISTVGKILFLEEVGERFYKIDRMLQHLFRAGKLADLKAVVLGQFTDCEADNFPFSISEMLSQKIGTQVPVFSGLQSGHGTPNFPLIHGAQAQITKSLSGFTFTQNLPPAV